MLRRCEAIVLNISRIAGVCRFEQDYFHFMICYGAMLDAAGDYHKFTFIELDRVTAELDAEAPAPREEELVSVVMVVPDEFALEFDEFDFLAVHLCYDFRPPMFRNIREFLRDANLIHNVLLHSLSTGRSFPFAHCQPKYQTEESRISRMNLISRPGRGRPRYWKLLGRPWRAD